MPLTNEITLLINARNQASKQVKQITKDLQATQKGTKQLDRDFRKMNTDTQKGVKKTSNAFKGLGGSITGLLGIGSFAAVAQMFTSNLDDMAQASGRVTTAVALFGEQAKQSMQEMDFLAISTEYAASISEVKSAWATLTLQMRGSERITNDTLRTVMALAEAGNMSADAAARMVAEAMQTGNLTGIEDALGIATGTLGTFEQAQERILDAGKASVSLWERTMQNLKNIFDPSWHAEYFKSWAKNIGSIFGMGEDNETIKGMDAVIAKIGEVKEAFLGSLGIKEGDLTPVPSGGTYSSIEAAIAAMRARVAAEINAAMEAITPSLVTGSQTPGLHPVPWAGVVEQPFTGHDGTYNSNGGYVPLMAKGGIVNSPTRAIIGESGPEAVIPLNKMGGMGGFTQTIILNNPQFNDEFGARTATRDINRLTREEFRRHGGAI